MRIAIISDVHSNLPALTAVLDDLTDPDRIIHAGDIVGYNPFPNEVIDVFQSQEILSVAGNHDRAVAGDSDFEFSASAERIIDWTRSRIPDDQSKYITALPTERTVTIDGQTIQLVHGSPSDGNEYVYPTDVKLEMIEKLDDAVDVLVWGHTHYPIVTKINGVLMINPGSVGQPRDGDWRSSYVLFDTGAGEVEFRRKPYDRDEVIAKARGESFPQKTIDLLRQS